jgi:translation initiation factor 1
MPRRSAQDADVVWSSADGDRRGRPGVAKARPAAVPLDDAGLRALASELKRRCGVGGSVRDGVIELQGDHRPVVMVHLRAAGYDAVLAGG